MTHPYVAKYERLFKSDRQRCYELGVGKLLDQFLAARQGLSPFSKRTYAQTFLALARHINSDFKKITAIDLSRWLESYHGQSQKTRLGKAKTILKFVHKGQLPVDINQLHLASRKRSRTIEREDFLTTEEIERMCKDGATSLRDKALLMVLYGTGARVGGVLKMQVKDVIQRNGVTALRVEDKQGALEYFMKPSALPWLQRWLKTFTKNEQEFPLWSHSRDRCKPLGYYGVLCALKRMAERVGISKPVNPHMFRHRRNTELLIKVGATKAKMIQGYEPSSQVLERTYTHLVDGDRVDAFRESEGLVVDTQTDTDLNKEPPVAMQVCPRCDFENQGAFLFCGRCGQALTDTALAQIVKEHEEDALLAEVLKHPKVRNEMVEALKTIMERKTES